MAENIDIRITATNQASGALQRVRADVQGLGKSAGSLNSLSGGMNSASSAAGGLSSALAGLGGAVAAAGIATLGMQAAQGAIELSKLGAQSLALKTSFEQVQGGAAQAAEILDALRAASRNMISDYDLMLSANKAALLGVADTAEEMAGLMRVAEVRGRAMGLSVAEAFSDIVTGLGRMSPMILDNLGITVDLDTATENYASQLGKTAGTLSDIERKQALVNAVLAQSAPLLDAANQSAGQLAGSGFAQLDAAWTNFTTHIGESLAPFFDARAGEIAGFINRVDSALNQSPEQIAQNQAQFAARESAAQQARAMEQLRVLRRLIDSGQTQFNRGDLAAGGLDFSALSPDIQDGISGLQNFSAATLDLMATMQGSWLATLQASSSAMGQLADATRPTAEAIAATNAAVAQAAQPVDAFARSFATASEILTAAEPKMLGIYNTLLNSGDIEGAKKTYNQIGGIIQEITAEWIRQGVPIEDISSTLLPKLLSEINNLVGAQISAGGAATDAGAQISSGFLASIPAIRLVIATVEQLIGASAGASAAVGAAVGAAERAVESGATAGRLRGYSPPKGAARLDPFAQRPTMGVNSSDGGAALGITAGVAGLVRKLPFLALQPRGIDAGVGAAYGDVSGGGGGGGIDNSAEQLASRIKSVLSGALKSGIDLSSILGREDAVEEPARRLADIAVRGFDSPWAAYFQEKFPEIWDQLQASGDPKTAAASILRDFEDGLRPELLDKDRAKELVHRALVGDANMAALANEIAAELSSEMGISLSQAQAAAQATLGGGTSSALGATFGDGVVQGVNDNGAGARAVAALAAQLTVKDHLATIYSAGQTHGAQYGSGFLAAVGANLPGALVAILVAAVTPGVLASVQAQNTRTGATSAGTGVVGAI